MQKPCPPGGCAGSFSEDLETASQPAGALPKFSWFYTLKWTLFDPKNTAYKNLRNTLPSLNEKAGSFPVLVEGAVSPRSKRVWLTP